jgi:hypothetical protein
MEILTLVVICLNLPHPTPLKHIFKLRHFLQTTNTFKATNPNNVRMDITITSHITKSYVIGRGGLCTVEISSHFGLWVWNFPLFVQLYPLSIPHPPLSSQLYTLRSLVFNVLPTSLSHFIITSRNQRKKTHSLNQPTPIRLNGDRFKIKTHSS